MKSDYKTIRQEIHTHIVHLEVHFTQMEIAELLTQKCGVSFYAKDINLLKNLKNTRWQGEAKAEKLVLCLNGLKYVWRDLQNEQSIENDIVSSIDAQKIENLLQQALATEFLVYQTVPHYEAALEKLENFYQKEGTAYQNIVKVSNRACSREWIINDDFNTSYFALIDIQIKRKSGNKIFVNTQEHWFLKWFSLPNKVYEYTYDVTNEQLYIIEKHNHEWKIVSNIYSSPNVSAPPAGKFLK